MPEDTNTETPMPNVTFDVGLGKQLPKGSVIDFDYDRYSEVAADMGMSDEEIAAAKIKVVVPKAMGEFKGSDPVVLMANAMQKYTKGGDYKPEGPDKGQIRIKLTKPENMSSAIIHETQHFADDLRGLHTEDRWEGVETNPPAPMRSKLTLLGGLAAMGAGLLEQRHPYLFWPLTIIGVPAASWGVAGTLAPKGSYANDPLEVHAREAEKKYADPDKPIITITKSK